MNKLLLVLTLVLAGCANHSTPVTTMTQEWCVAHTEASPQVCDRNPLKQYDPQGHMPAVVYGDICHDRYVYGAYGTTVITCWGQK